MEINYDKLVKEWSNRMSGRAPIYTNRYHRTVLREVMKDFGYSLELIDGVHVEPTKKNFKNEVTKQVINLGRLLQEASVFQDKYQAGDRFMLGSVGQDRMKKHSGESSIPDGIWIKVNEPKDTKNVIDVIHDENGRVEFWVKSEKNSKVYHVKGKPSVIDKWFKKATKQAGDIIPNSQLGSGITINQNLNISTGVSQTVKAEVMNLLPAIKQETVNAVAESRSRGGSFARTFGA